MQPQINKLKTRLALSLRRVEENPFRKAEKLQRLQDPRGHITNLELRLSCKRNNKTVLQEEQRKIHPEEHQEKEQEKKQEKE